MAVFGLLVCNGYVSFTTAAPRVLCLVLALKFTHPHIVTVGINEHIARVILYTPINSFTG